MQSKEWKSHT